MSKRKKEEEKKERIKKINEQYEQIRSNRQEKIKNKIFQSEEIKAKNLQLIQKKLKVRDDKHKEIRNKIYHRTLDEIEKSCTERRVYENESQSRYNKSGSLNLT